MLEIIIVVLLLVVSALVYLAFKIGRLADAQTQLPEVMTQLLETKHRAMLGDLHEGLARQGDRVTGALTETSERLRNAVAQELKETREITQALQLSLSESLAKNRETVMQQLADMNAGLQAKQDQLRTDIIGKTLEKLAEQGRAEQELIQSTMRNVTLQLTERVEAMGKTVDTRLEQISGKVSERLDEGFKKTNETFANVMTRLGVIDEAQKKIDSLATNVVSLQELLGDKRSRGAFGEVQLEALIQNILPHTPQQPAYAFQHTLSNRSRADCILFLPQPTGNVVVDAKFPLENYHRMLNKDTSEVERNVAQRQFKADIKKHVDDISGKYIIVNETSDGAVMFIPAEAVFAEIHAYHSEVVDYAMQKRVWIVSPTTLMAVLNTARAVLKDVKTREQIHIIKDELGKLSKDFTLFDKRMKSLADHIRMASKDVDEVHISSRKITQRFAQIEAAELQLEDQVPIVIESFPDKEA